VVDRLVDAPVLVHLLLLAALTTRATVLIVVDKAGGPVRNLLGRLGPWGRYLAGCAWCVGAWCSAAVVTAWVHVTGPTLLVGAACAAALAAGVWGAWLKSALPPPAE
jgi:hypothetical protein